MELKFGVMKWRNVMSFGQVRQEIDLSKPGTYHIVGDTRLSANYEIRDDKSHPALGNLALIQYQLSF